VSGSESLYYIPVYLKTTIKDVEFFDVVTFDKTVINAYIIYKCCDMFSKGVGNEEERKQLLYLFDYTAESKAVILSQAIFNIGACPLVARMLYEFIKEHKETEFVELVCSKYEERGIIMHEDPKCYKKPK